MSGMFRKIHAWISTIVTASIALFVAPVYGESPTFSPDPASVQRHGRGYRFPQDGWIVLHIEGTPYERGYQHGVLLKTEIENHLRCFAKTYGPTGPEDAWKLLRILTDALFVRTFDAEYLEEMRGIADGAASQGGKMFDRSIDLVDIVTVNMWPEIMTLEAAARRTPTGLEGRRFSEAGDSAPQEEKPGHCSAFAATGSATRDGKIVFGHITMFDLYPSGFYNLWLDVQPDAGHRVVMQSFPGGIHSAMDYYINSAGIMVSETTIDQTLFHVQGRALAGRIRKALQYSDSIDGVVQTLREANNGLYSNEWLLGDAKTNEIAMFELGTATDKLYRSSRGEWFGGAEGFYWGCNNMKDLGVRLETVSSVHDRPASMVWKPSDRDIAWLQLYREHNGKIDEDFARLAFTSAPICLSASVDAKFTTTTMARELQSWALFGPPRGKTWKPTESEKRDFEEIEPLVSHPWTVLHAKAPESATHEAPAVDFDADAACDESNPPTSSDRKRRPRSRHVAWRGTLIPKSPGDIWFAAAFAQYHDLVAKELDLVEASDDKCLCDDDHSSLGSSVFSLRSRYDVAACVLGDAALVNIHPAIDQGYWYDLAVGKGAMVLQELRRTMGHDRFVLAMDEFGTAHAGMEASWRDFQSTAARHADADLSPFFDAWVLGKGLPKWTLQDVRWIPGASQDGTVGRIVGRIDVDGFILPATIEVTMESAGKEQTLTTSLDPRSGEFDVESLTAPTRLVVDQYARSARSNGGSRELTSFLRELSNAIIVYGAAGEEVANREAAELLADFLRTQRSNVDVPIFKDSAVTESQLASHHLLLVGRPSVNGVTKRLEKAFEIEFGVQSFRAGPDRYAHHRTAVVASGANPLNRRYSAVVFAGLSGHATYTCVSNFDDADNGCNVKIILAGGCVRRFVAPAPDLIHSFAQDSKQAEFRSR